MMTEIMIRFFIFVLLPFCLFSKSLAIGVCEWLGFCLGESGLGRHLLGLFGLKIPKESRLFVRNCEHLQTAEKGHQSIVDHERKAPNVAWGGEGEEREADRH